ncbi:hypothetical protein H2202_000264 [Exophiala xenobiotica]|nr:hypothetical protein H2202_000264 [Exophiala xenobiotica]KAK5193907.1 hypothetical protein LTR92_006247 [Exophiala xenobiotica]KAK5236983.1 hypothetical protein LTR47_002161 [Exophiala xenobiotica]KAK5252183.1 hypothetical protein LTS06_003274 [Exophiala xenobiotica]KAK5280527.1 hypothetical protein LTR40_006218 [Exophiala xenobiotica]
METRSAIGPVVPSKCCKTLSANAEFVRRLDDTARGTLTPGRYSQLDCADKKIASVQPRRSGGKGHLCWTVTGFTKDEFGQQPLTSRSSKPSLKSTKKDKERSRREALEAAATNIDVDENGERWVLCIREPATEQAKPSEE